ncbi:hypothetical protein SELMODRAFT_411727 [Selaginella moellendorffii]|uniref:Peptidase A1 domain-containing protein n=1 Tax=Selaginella moellendorffii TaxID=88036 RepID=D8RIU7_SELML|nr:hypothetical protein SELMODRAFT_411727 [Selaginella moellendorffii]
MLDNIDGTRQNTEQVALGPVSKVTGGSGVLKLKHRFSELEGSSKQSGKRGMSEEHFRQLMDHTRARSRRFHLEVDLMLNGSSTSAATYYAQIGVGHPVQFLNAIVDTGSDILWSVVLSSCRVQLHSMTRNYQKRHPQLHVRIHCVQKAVAAEATAAHIISHMKTPAVPQLCNEYFGTLAGGWYYGIREDVVYNVKLVSLSVNSKALPIEASEFEYNATVGNGGTIIDSGTGSATFPSKALALFVKAVSKFTTAIPTAPLEYSGSPCFISISDRNSVEADFPNVTLKFDGGATMELTAPNYLEAVVSRKLSESTHFQGVRLVCINWAVGNSTILGGFITTVSHGSNRFTPVGSKNLWRSSGWMLVHKKFKAKETRHTLEQKGFLPPSDSGLQAGFALRIKIWILPSRSESIMH